MNEFYIEYDRNADSALFKQNGELLTGSGFAALTHEELDGWFRATAGHQTLGEELDAVNGADDAVLIFQSTAADFDTLDRYFSASYSGTARYLLRHVPIRDDAETIEAESGQIHYGPLVNDEKTGVIEYNGKRYLRIAIKAKVVLPGEQLFDVIDTYARPYLQPGDVLFMSEKMVACTQRRAIPVVDIHPRWSARMLSKLVYKNPHGVGLTLPITMEMAIREVGLPRILFAAFIAGIGKLFRKRGWFYIVAGYRASSIDGPSPKNIAPYDRYVILGPVHPDETAQELSDHLGGISALIVDVNDFGGVILGASKTPLTREDYVHILRDNPLGQTNEQTPLGIIRPLDEVVAAEQEQTEPETEEGTEAVNAEDAVEERA